MGFRMSGLLVLLLLTGVSWGQDGLDQLDLLDQMLVDMQDQSRAELVDRVRSLEIENAELRERNLVLEKELESIDIPGLEAALNELMSENESLRGAMEALLEQVEEEGAEVQVIVEQPQAKPDVAYRIIKEWGRSPEVTATMGGNVASLKGMSIYVDFRLPEGDLEALARFLRASYDMYDNVNIEVFNDENASRDFADSGRASQRHRVISVSKHQKTGRDLVMLFRNGQPRELF